MNDSDIAKLEMCLNNLTNQQREYLEQTLLRMERRLREAMGKQTMIIRNMREDIKKMEENTQQKPTQEIQQKPIEVMKQSNEEIELEVNMDKPIEIKQQPDAKVKLPQTEQQPNVIGEQMCKVNILEVNTEQPIKETELKNNEEVRQEESIQESTDVWRQQHEDMHSVKWEQNQQCKQTTETECILNLEVDTIPEVMCNTIEINNEQYPEETKVLQEPEILNIQWPEHNNRQLDYKQCSRQGTSRYKQQSTDPTDLLIQERGRKRTSESDEEAVATKISKQHFEHECEREGRSTPTNIQEAAVMTSQPKRRWTHPHKNSEPMSRWNQLTAKVDTATHAQRKRIVKQHKRVRKKKQDASSRHDDVTTQGKKEMDTPTRAANQITTGFMQPPL